MKGTSPLDATCLEVFEDSPEIDPSVMTIVHFLGLEEIMQGNLWMLSAGLCPT